MTNARYVSYHARTWLLLALVTGCSESAEPPATPQTGPVVAGTGAAASSNAGGAGAAGRAANGGGTNAVGGGRGAVAGSAASAGADAEDSGVSDDADGGVPPEAVLPAGKFVALTYNVAGLPEGLSSSNPSVNTPLIAPRLNAYDVVLLQETWLTPDPNPLEPLRGYHEILVAASQHPYKTPPAPQPLGSDPTRITALLSDGLNVFSRFPLADTQRQAWSTCVNTDNDCLAFKGFSMTPLTLASGYTVHVYDLHMEAGESPEDDTAREGDIDQLIAFIMQHSRDTALIVGGDFNLSTSTEPAGSQFLHLQSVAGLTDACSVLSCPQPGNIDKLLYRSSAQLALAADQWSYEDETFVTADGSPLSDHLPVAVHFTWSAKAQP